MRRLASTIFLVIFTASIVGRTIERTDAWAAQHAHNFKHSGPGRAGAQVAEARKQSPRQSQTKLLEDGSVLDVSFARSTDTPTSTDALAHGLTGFVADPDRWTVSSRAPPSLL